MSSIVSLFVIIIFSNLLNVDREILNNQIVLAISLIFLMLVLNKDIIFIENDVRTTITIPIYLPAVIYLDPFFAAVCAIIPEYIMNRRSKRQPIKIAFNVSLTGLVITTLAYFSQSIVKVHTLSILSPEFFIFVLSLGFLYSFLINGLTVVVMALQRQELDSEIISAFYDSLKTGGITIFLGIINVFIFSLLGILGVAISTFIMYIIKPVLKFRYILNNELSTFTQFVLHILKLYDPITHAHSERVKNWTVMIAKEMRLSSKEIHELSQAASWHDIGKIEIPHEIINKSGKLTDEEFDMIKSHPEKGYLLVKDMYFFKEYLPVIRHHHERIDGKGYPLGLKGNEIPLHARIMCVADSFDAMTSKRSYKQGMSMAEAVEELKRCSGTQFDPIIVSVFIRALQKKYGGEFEKWGQQHQISSF